MLMLLILLLLSRRCGGEEAADVEKDKRGRGGQGEFGDGTSARKETPSEEGREGKRKTECEVEWSWKGSDDERGRRAVRAVRGLRTKPSEEARGSRVERSVPTLFLDHFAASSLPNNSQRLLETHIALRISP